VVVVQVLHRRAARRGAAPSVAVEHPVACGDLRVESAGFSRRTVYVELRKNPSFKISFQGSEAMRLCAYMYDGVPQSERLSRKFEVYASFVRESVAVAER
jgi:hypothetical protein